MPTVLSMTDLKEQMIKYADDRPDLIPLLADVGIGMHWAPSKKNPVFRVGEVRVPAEALKEEYRDNVLHKDVNIKIIAFIPRHMASDELINILEK